MRLEQEHVNNVQLVDESVLLVFLPYACAESRYGQGHVVHGLDLGGLSGFSITVSVWRGS